MKERRPDARGGYLWLVVLALGFACGSPSSPLQTTCLYAGRHYTIGDSFPSVDGCAVCSCTTGGVICGHRACPPDAGAADAAATVDAATDVPMSTTDAGPATCAIEHTFQFHNDGGFVAYVDWSTLSPPRTHTIARDHLHNAAPNTCTRQLPCSAMGDVDIQNIREALAHPDVVSALAMTTRPFFGTDTRPADGTVFIFNRDDGRGFDVGSGSSVPAGVRALANLLLRLQQETAATSTCSGL